ncbi:WG repeat-containing protein [Psychrobacter glaciei]|uniref:WG repeat-containing protein n=1 Tax=Psychrobacter glaciei TaxID=619771 RepID=UPI001F05773D|nr:WG repeat-containing protein [Psychrobacter glaciei]MCH1781984.1 WG repeat-containing protein [Psychrobacter glaciei]
MSLVLLLISLAAYADDPVAAYKNSDSSESCLPNWSNRSNIAEYNQNNARGFELVRHGAAYDLVDDKGTVLYTRLYEIQPYDDDRIVARRQGKHGVIGPDGQLILDFDYHDILLSPDTSIYSVEILDGNIEGSVLIDDSGNWIYPSATKNKTAIEAATEIEVIYPIHANVDTGISYFQVEVESHEQYTDTIKNTGIIDHTGRTIVPIEYYRIDSEISCSNNKLTFMGWKSGYLTIMNELGQTIIEEQANRSVEVFNKNKSLFSLKVYEPKSKQFIGGFDYTGLITEKIVNEYGKVIIESDSVIQQLDGGSILYRFMVNNKFGLIDDEANIVIEPIFDDITNVGSFGPVIKVEKSGKQALIIYDLETDTLVPSSYYDYISTLSNHYPSNLQQLQARINVSDSTNSEPSTASGSLIKENSFVPNNITNKYDYEYDANELFTFANEGKQGLMTAHNNMLIPNNYDSITAYKRLLKVRLGSKYGLVTTVDETVLPIVYDDITEDSRIGRDSNLFMIKKEGRQGILDEFGQVVVLLRDMMIPNILNTSLEDILIFEKEGLYGLIEMKSGKQLLPAEFEHINVEHYTDYILAQKEGRYELYDRSGELVYRADDDIVKISTIDTDINLYDLVSFDPRLSVETKDKYILIKNQDDLYGLVEETSGQLILPVEYEDIQYSPTADSLKNLRDGKVTPLFLATKNDQSLLLNKLGEVLIANKKDIFNIMLYPSYIITMAEISTDKPVKDESVFKWNPTELNLSETGYKMGIIDTDGKELLSADYSMIMPYFNGDTVYIYAVKNNIAYRYDANLQLIDTKDTSELEQVLTSAWSDE